MNPIYIIGLELSIYSSSSSFDFLLNHSGTSLIATSADSVPSSNLVRITIASIGTTFGNLQRRRY